MVLEIIRLKAGITANVEILKRNLIGKDGGGTKQFVVKNCNSFLGGDEAVHRMETAQEVRQIDPRDKNCIGREGKFRWTSVGFINFTCPCLTRSF